MWERGLKSNIYYHAGKVNKVAPRVGARIEIPILAIYHISFPVAPRVGARIEIQAVSMYFGE